MSEPYIYLSETKTSNCCGEPVYDDSDICMGCGEHCMVVEPCPECNGKGDIEVMDMDKVHIRTVTPPYKTVTCERCDGEGYIEVEL